MVVEITRYQPILDIAIPVVEEFVQEGETKVVTSTHPDAVGLVIDLQHLLHTFYRYFDTNVTVKRNGVEDSFVFTQYKSEGIEHKLLEVELNNGLGFNPERTGDFFPSTVLEARGDVKFPNKIRVNATNNKKLRGNPFGIQLSKHITRPKQVEKIKLDFEYMNLSNFPVSTFCQDFSSLGDFEYEDSHKIEMMYPVSGSEYHGLNIDAWRFFQLPVFWDAWSQWHSQALRIDCGNGTVESISEEYTEKVDRVREHIEKSKNVCYEIIERIVGDGKLDDLLDRLNCPRYLWGYFLNKPFRTLRYIIKSNFDEGNYAQRLVDTYNEEYASRNGVRRITVEDLRNGLENRTKIFAGEKKEK